MFLSEWREFQSAPCLAGVGGLDDNSRPDDVEIALVRDMLPSLFPSWSGWGLISTPGIPCLSVIRRIRFAADTETVGNALTFWRRNYFLLILAHPVYKM